MVKPSEAQQHWLDELATLTGSSQARTGVSTEPTASVALARAASAEGVNASAPPQSQGGAGTVKIGAMVELSSKDFSPYATKYGSLVIQATVKTTATIELGAGGTTGFSGTVTSKDKPSGRTIGTKKSFSFKGIDDRELFDGFDIKNISIGAEFEISELDVSVSATFAFTLATKAFEAPALFKIVILMVKSGEHVQGPGVEFRIAPWTFKRNIGGVDATLLAEFKGTFLVDVKKVGAEVGKKIIEKAAKELLEKEAKKQGLKALSRRAAVALLKDLGPLAAAFGVGLDIGKLLNAYTAAPEAAGFAYEEILGDLNKRYHKTNTLGKLWLVSSNSPRILGAMIAAGVTGAAVGMADLVLFKLMGLDKLDDYAQALADFGSDVTAAMKVVRDAIEQGFGGMLLYNAIMLGVKFNPRHAILAHGSLEPVFASIFAKIGPMYRASGGLQPLINVHVKDVQINEVAFQKFAKFAAGFKLGYGNSVDLTDESTVAKSLRELLLIEFLGFLQANKMIRYNVKVDGNMDPNEIDPKLLDELFA